MGELKRVLSQKSILLITINSIAGSGLFFLPKKAAEAGGPSSILAWGLISIIALYTAFCFGELVSMYPYSGGVYEFAKKAYGHFPSFMIGWLAWLVGNITTAMLIVGAVQYIMPQSGLFVPKLILCLTWVIVFNIMAYIGVKQSAGMLVIFAIAILSLTGFLIFSSFFDLQALLSSSSLQLNFSPDKLTPFFQGDGVWENASLILFSVFLISEAFFGLESVCFLAGETKNPEKVIPRSLIIAAGTMAFLTFLLVLGSMGAVHWQEFTESSAPFSHLAKETIGLTAAKGVTVGIFVVIIGGAASWVVTGPRLILSLARDKLFPTGFAKLHPKFNTPYKAIIFQALVSTALIVLALKAGEEAYETLLLLLAPLVLFMMSMVLLTVPILRYKHPHKERPFKAPFVKKGVPLLIVLNGLLVFSWFSQRPQEASQIISLGASLFFFGMPIYLLLVTYFDPDIIIQLNNFFAHLNLLFERILLPKKVMRRYEEHLGDIKGYKVLEFGCGVGSLTKEIAQKVGGNGYIYATDMSRNSVNIAQKRMVKKGHNNIYFIHDVHQINRVHDSIPTVDAVVSFGMLGYVQDIRKVLKEINRILPENGKIVFVDFVDLFKVLPNVNWLSHGDKLTELFRECGFAVKIEKIKTPFWNYLIVYGFKTDYDVPFV